MEEMLRQMVSVYAGHFGVILAGIFATRKSQEPTSSSQIFVTALLLVLVWNFNITWPLIYLFYKAGPQFMDINWCLGYWKTAPELTSFLCTTVLTFFFVQQGVRNEPATNT